MSDHCVAPHEVEEGDLVAYLEGVASAQVVSHIHRCPSCAAIAAELAVLDRHLLAHYYRASCPSAEVLLHYEANLLTTVRRKEVEAHLTSCGACQGEVAALAEVGEAGLLRQEKAQHRTSWIDHLIQEGRQFIEAVLRPLPPKIALRSKEMGGDEFVYEAGEYQTVIEIFPDPDEPSYHSLEGLVMREGGTGLTPATAHLIRETTIMSSAPINSAGFFSIGRIQPGRYTLQIEFKADLIIIPTLDVPAYDT